MSSMEVMADQYLDMTKEAGMEQFYDKMGGEQS